MDWFTKLKNKGFEHRSDICFTDHRHAVLFTTPNPKMEMPLFCGVLINDLYYIYASGNLEKIINDKTDEVIWQLYPVPEWSP